VDPGVDVLNGAETEAAFAVVVAVPVSLCPEKVSTLSTGDAEADPFENIELDVDGTDVD
jgi:hypothetical protein